MGVRKGRRKRPPKIRFPLREILAARGLSQYRCAQIVGITQQQVSALCNGRKNPSWRMLLAIMTAIGADLGDLAPKGGAA
jgi:transcriptional regulator with XRE-family HTH domain